MKFLADENIATSVVRSLRKAGFDVKDVKENGLFGTSDNTLLTLAVQENRIILTHDKDFGNSINNQRQQHKGIILLRVKNQKPDHVISVLFKILHTRQDEYFENNLVIITENALTIYWKEGKKPKPF